MSVTGMMTVLVKDASADMVRRIFKWNPEIHQRPKLVQIGPFSPWWKLSAELIYQRDKDHHATQDLVYSNSKDELAVWADLNGIPIANKAEL